MDEEFDSLFHEQPDELISFSRRKTIEESDPSFLDDVHNMKNSRLYVDKNNVEIILSCLIDQSGISNVN